MKTGLGAKQSKKRKTLDTKTEGSFTYEKSIIRVTAKTKTKKEKKRKQNITMATTTTTKKENNNKNDEQNKLNTTDLK